MNKRVFAGRTNQSVINLVSMAVAYKHNQPGTFYLIKNGTLGGNPNFTDYDTTSCSAIDIAATTVTVSNNRQIVYAIPIAETGDSIIDLISMENNGDLTLQPGETITLACKTFSATASYVSGTLNTKEDQ
jgi:hypothetical protein